MMTIYDDLNLEPYEEKVRDYLADLFIDKQIEEITSGMIQDEIQAELEWDWENLIERNLFVDIEKNYFVCSGTLGLWDGTYDGGGVIKNSHDFYELLDGYTIIEDKEGRLFVTSVHHDGTNQFELRRLTKEGREF